MAEAIAAGETRAGSADLALVERAQAGDQAAYEALVRPRLGRLLRLALSILANEADARDAVQESCLHAWRELSRLRDPDRFEAWLWQIVINACRSALRGRSRLSVKEIAIEALPVGYEPVQAGRSLGEGLSAVDLVRRAFGRLDPDKRTILVLHHVDDRSIREIAALLRIPQGTAKWRLHAARQALERALEEERR